MTTTAQGTSIRCDSPNCALPATIEEGVWGFCATHAGKGKPDPAPPPRADHLSRAHTPGPVDLRPADTPAVASPSAPMVQVMGGGTIGLLLEQASGHSNRRVVTLGEKIETQIEQLRQLIATLADDEQRKQAEIAAKAAAKEKVATLEAELKAARAALRGNKPTRTTPPPSSTGTPGAFPCRHDGCDRSSPTAAGRSAHERHCTAGSCDA